MRTIFQIHYKLVAFRLISESSTYKTAVSVHNDLVSLRFVSESSEHQTLFQYIMTLSPLDSCQSAVNIKQSFNT